MEDLNGTLFRLLKDELDALRLGHPFNKDRLRKMKEICHLLTYYQYVDVSNDDIIKLVRMYEY